MPKTLSEIREIKSEQDKQGVCLQGNGSVTEWRNFNAGQHKIMATSVDVCALESSEEEGPPAGGFREKRIRGRNGI